MSRPSPYSTVLTIRLLGAVCAAGLSLSCSQQADSKGLEEKLAYQKTIEERNAVEIAAPTGSEPVYTMDWVGDYEDRWREELGHLKDQPDVRILEIGSFEGRSANWFLDNIATHPSSNVTCVDLFGPRLDEFFDHNIRVGGDGERVTKITGKSQKVLRGLNEQFDVVYVDACHLATCAIADIILSWDLLKVGGVMIVDDYGWTQPALHDRPELAVDSFLQIFEPYIELRYKGYQVIVRKKSEAY